MNESKPVKLVAGGASADPRVRARNRPVHALLELRHGEGTRSHGSQSFASTSISPLVFFTVCRKSPARDWRFVRRRRVVPTKTLLRRLTALEVVAHGEGHGVRPVGQVDVGSALPPSAVTPSPKFQVRDSIASRSELVEVSVKSTSTGALEL